MENDQLSFWISKLEEYLIDHQTDDGSHDINHFRRVWFLADKFIHQINSSKFEIDKLVVLAACYLHDIVSYPKSSPLRSQSSRDAAKKAALILRDLDFPLEKISHVEHAIAAHSFSANIAPETMEAKIVQDADRMESLGAIGLARCFYTSGLNQSRLFHNDDPFATNRELNDQAYAVDHFYTKLLKLPELMQTEMGKREALERNQLLLTFLSSLKEELRVL
jgi:uncharacterized protein